MRLRCTLIVGAVALGVGTVGAAGPAAAGGPATGRAPVARPALVYLDPHVVPLNDVPAPARILDVSRTRILYAREQHGRGVDLLIKHRDTGAVLSVPGGPWRWVGLARLVPRGAAFVAWSGRRATADRVLVWRNGDRLRDLGAVTSPGSVRVNGSYLVWTSGRTLRRRDLDTDTTTRIATNAAAGSEDVLPDGDVVYSAARFGLQPGAVYRYHGGRPTALPGVFGRGPIGDAGAVVYCTCNWPAEAWSVVRWEAGRTTDLTTRGPARPSPGNAYEVSGGWTAFLQPDSAGGPPQVWLLAPDGTVTEVPGGNPDGTAALHLVALSPTGELLYTAGDRLFQVVPGHPRRLLLAAGLGPWDARRTGGTANTVRFLDGHWLLAAGDTLYLQTRG